MLDTSHEEPTSTSTPLTRDVSDPSRTKHLHDDDDDEENDELAQEIEGEKQQTQWLWRAPVVIFGLTLLIVSAILPHSFGIISSPLFLLILLLESYFLSTFRQKKMKILRFLFRFLLYCLGAYCFILLILSMIGLAPNAFPKQFPTSCPYPHANNCALLCDSSNKTTSSSKVFNVERSDGDILSMKFTCNGNHRVEKLSTPWMNATSILQASEVVQHAMLASNVWVDSIQEVTDNGQNDEAMSSSGAFFLFLLLLP